MNKHPDFTRDGIIAAGVDIGAVSSKAVILLNGEIYTFSKSRTITPAESAEEVIKKALSKTTIKLENIHFIVATGWGRNQVPFAHKTLTEIACAALGAVKIWGSSVRTILDAGGQSCKVIHCTERGRVTDFLWNDKCAAGIGRSIETLAYLAGKEIDEMGNIALQFEGVPKLSDFCFVYAISEVFDMIRSNIQEAKVIAGYHHAVGKRISTLVARSGLKEDFVVIGGLANNPGIVKEVEKNLNITAINASRNFDPALVVGLGAAFFADAFYKKSHVDKE